MDDETIVTAEELRQSRRRVLQGAIGGFGAAALVAGSGLTVHQVLARTRMTTMTIATAPGRAAVTTIMTAIATTPFPSPA